MEGDQGFGLYLDSRYISTHALTWRATPAAPRWDKVVAISTHALTWRATFSRCRSNTCTKNFYPRPHMEGDSANVFLPRLHHISTHALTWRATCQRHLYRPAGRFLPTPSHGGRLAPSAMSASKCVFLPTPSHGGRLRHPPYCTLILRFLPTPSHGGRPMACIRWRSTSPFLPTPSHGGRHDIL